MQQKVTVATVYGRSYYRIINALKLMNLQFESLSPQEAAQTDAKIIITTKHEAEILKRKDFLLDTELEKLPVLMKAKILRCSMGTVYSDTLTIGVDPGKRIGISIIFMREEIGSFVESSPSRAVQLISVLISGIDSRKRIVRIGDGDPNMARLIATMLKSRFETSVEIEIVDERGTSLPHNPGKNRRGIRDILSARKIAHRNGRPFRLIQPIVARR
ncbi:MAG TPA: hypothetical protein VGW09_09730 [Nitrososphaeraceae archaeon]|nr:hypothetical protein [Nitrososphaeraceae archaeon]